LHAATELRPCLRAATYQSLIGLLAVSGIRIGEGIALDVDDLDTHADLLLVREAKFGLCRFLHKKNYVACRIMSRRLRTVGPPRWRAWSLSRHNSARPTSGREM
jgi:integrase